MIKTKKGIVFTIVAVLLVLLVTAIYSTNLVSFNPYSNSASTTRIKVLDNYVKNFEDYVGRSLEISSHHTLVSLYTYVTTPPNPTFFASELALESAFDSCMRCGFINCVGMPATCPGLTGKNFNSMIQNITQITQKNLNIVTEYEIINISIHQEHHYDVEVEAYVNYVIYDTQKDNYAVWNRTKKFTATVSIVGMYDPLIAVNTNNAFQRRIIPTSICAYNESCWNPTTFQQLYLSEEYHYYSNGTSYLSRFYNSTLGSECCGLESFLNTSIASGFNSYVDNYYWSNVFLCAPPTNNRTILEINDTAPRFRLDEATAARFGLTSYGYQVCP